jgi:1-deoxyxylulose-5-phosphate synthase
MEYRNLGRTGLKVSRVVLGGLNFGGVISEDDVLKLVHEAWDRGITTFYTADDYQAGNAERALGKALKSRRDDVVIYVKCGYHVGLPNSTWPQQMAGTIDYTQWVMTGVSPTSHGHSRKHLMTALDQSLRNLQTDYIDIYSPHFYDAFTPLEETLETLNDFVRLGKVRYIGCSQHQPYQLYEALAVSDAHGWPRYSCIQQGFSVLERGAMQSVMPALRNAGVSMFAGDNNTAMGLITSDYARRALELRNLPMPVGDGNPAWYRYFWNERTFDALAKLQVLADEMGRSLGEMCLAWLLAQEPIIGLQVSPYPPHQYDSLSDAVTIPAGATEKPLAADELAALDSLLSDLPTSTRA